MTLRTLLFTIVASIACAEPCAGGALENVQQGNPQAQHVWHARDGSVAVPFEWHDGRLVIGVRVNDSAPLRLASNYLTRGRSFNGPYERVTARLAAFSLGGFEFPGLVTHFDRTDFKDLGRGSA